MYRSLEIIEPLRLTGIYSFFRHHYDENYIFRGEMHDFWEVVYVQKGKLGVTAGEQVYDLSEGELIVHPPMEFHNLFVNDPTGADVVIFSFTAQTEKKEVFSGKVFRLEAFQQELVCQMFSYLDGRAEKNEDHHLWKESADKSSDSMWYLSYMKLFEADPHALVMASAFMTQLLFSLTESEGRVRENRSGDAGLFRKAMDYLNTHANKSVGVDELASTVGVSRSGINRLFRKFAGVSVHRYCLMQKIKTATECLQSGVSVTQTSQRLGFSNQSYFSACYKRETGQNPSEIKKAPSDEGAGNSFTVFSSDRSDG